MTRRSTRLQRRLPSPLDAIVGQIETEIGELFGSESGGDVLANGADTPPERAFTPHEPGDNGRVESAVRDILMEIGEDPDREGLRATPERVHRMYRELLAGYQVDPERLLNNAIFEVDYSEMVVVKGIEFYSLCEHHLLPFYGHAAVAYIPRGRVVGLSKIPRIVEMFARRLQVQERMTQEIADFVQERLDPKGVGVVIEATHLCMVMRGVRKEALVTTAALHGLMQSRDRTRAEFLAHLERGA
jgi:GTP cyclohydrolase I